MQVLKRAFSDSEARSEIKQRLLCPSDDWGPALPEMFKKYSQSHGFGMRSSPGEDDVFGDTPCEMTGDASVFVFCKEM